MGENRLMSDLWEINQHLNEQVEELQQANSKLTAEKESLEKRFEELQIAKAVDDAMIAQYDDDLKTRSGMRAVAEIERLREKYSKSKVLIEAMFEDIKRYAGGMCRVCKYIRKEAKAFQEMCECEHFCATNKRKKWQYQREAEILALIGGAENG